MSEQSGRGNPQYRRRRPKPDPRGGATGEEQALKGDVHLKGSRSLERLRERVERAAQELVRLRQENAALAARLHALESEAALPQEGTLLGLPEDPETLRRRVTGFIEAIDQYLANDQAS